MSSSKSEKDQERQHSELVLPEPKISERELEQVVKIGHASDNVPQFIDGNATSGLLTDYTEPARTNAVAARTMRTPMPKDSATSGDVSSTPLRDQMPINDEAGIGNAFEKKANLKRALAGLPAPKNDFEVVASDDEGAEDDETVGREKRSVAPDEAMPSQVVQRKLSKPSNVNETALRPTIGTSDSYKMKKLAVVESKLLHSAVAEEAKKNEHKLKRCPCGEIDHSAQLTLEFSSVKGSKGTSFSFKSRDYPAFMGSVKKVPTVVKQSIRSLCNRASEFPITNITSLQNSVHFHFKIDSVTLYGVFYVENSRNEAPVIQFLSDCGLVRNVNNVVFCKQYKDQIQI